MVVGSERDIFGQERMGCEMRYIPCPFCKRLFESDKSLNKHIKDIKGHGKVKCSNCGDPLKRCRDIDGVGQSFACSRRNGG